MAKFKWVKTDRDYNNYKPFRTEAQKAEARKSAKKINGTWVSTASVSQHPVRRDQMGLTRVEQDDETYD